MNLSFYTNFSNSLTQQQAQIDTLQQQISTGLSVQTPDQNPAAYQSATLNNDQISALNNDNTTQAAIQVQLGSVNNIYQSTGNLLNNMQSVVEQALNGTTSAQNLNALASQVAAASQQMLGLANTTSPNGGYLFAGSRGGIPPFQSNGSGNIQYFGDAGQSQAAISPNISASTIANGSVFVSSLSGDGVGSVSAAGTNTGTGQVIPQGTVNAAAASAFQSGNTPITISFSSGTGSAVNYTATQGGTTLATGPVSGDTNVQLAGVDYQITGSPAAGDSFTVAPARPQSVFSLLQNLHNALANAGSTPAQVAQTNQVLNESLAGIAQYQQSVATAQAQNGVTLQLLGNTAASNTSQSTQLQVNVQNTTAVNMPAAITSLDQSLTAMQAAMKAFASVQSLSLFNYI